MPSDQSSKNWTLTFARAVFARMRDWHYCMLNGFEASGGNMSDAVCSNTGRRVHIEALFAFFDDNNEDKDYLKLHIRFSEAVDTQFVKYYYSGAATSYNHCGLHTIDTFRCLLRSDAAKNIIQSNVFTAPEL